MIEAKSIGAFASRVEAERAVVYALMNRRISEIAPKQGAHVETKRILGP